MKKRILSMLVLLMTAVTGAWADTTVTWEGTTLQGIAVCKGYNYGVTTESMTVDGITITANDGFLLNDQLGVMLMSGAANGVVFSAENNIKSITITSTGFSKFTPDGSFQMSGGSHTYEVSPAATSYGFANGVDITGITKIEITLEGAPAAAGYTVSMKEGTEDATSWTITPAEESHLRRHEEGEERQGREEGFGSGWPNHRHMGLHAIVGICRSTLRKRWRHAFRRGFSGLRK